MHCTAVVAPVSSFCCCPCFAVVLDNMRSIHSTYGTVLYVVLNRRPRELARDFLRRLMRCRDGQSWQMMYGTHGDNNERPTDPESDQHRECTLQLAIFEVEVSV